MVSPYTSGTTEQLKVLKEYRAKRALGRALKEHPDFRVDLRTETTGAGTTGVKTYTDVKTGEVFARGEYVFENERPTSRIVEGQKVPIGAPSGEYGRGIYETKYPSTIETQAEKPYVPEQPTTFHTPTTNQERLRQSYKTASAKVKGRGEDYLEEWGERAGTQVTSEYLLGSPPARAAKGAVVGAGGTLLMLGGATAFTASKAARGDLSGWLGGVGEYVTTTATGIGVGIATLPGYFEENLKTGKSRQRMIGDVSEFFGMAYGSGKVLSIVGGSVAKATKKGIKGTVSKTKAGVSWYRRRLATQRLDQYLGQPAYKFDNTLDVSGLLYETEKTQYFADIVDFGEYVRSQQGVIDIGDKTIGFDISTGIKTPAKSKQGVVVVEGRVYRFDVSGTFKSPGKKATPKKVYTTKDVISIFPEEKGGFVKTGQQTFQMLKTETKQATKQEQVFQITLQKQAQKTDMASLLGMKIMQAQKTAQKQMSPHEHIQAYRQKQIQSQLSKLSLGSFLGQAQLQLLQTKQATKQQLKQKQALILGQVQALKLGQAQRTLQATRQKLGLEQALMLGQAQILVQGSAQALKQEQAQKTVQAQATLQAPKLKNMEDQLFPTFPLGGGKGKYSKKSTGILRKQKTGYTPGLTSQVFKGYLPKVSPEFAERYKSGGFEIRPQVRRKGEKRTPRYRLGAGIIISGKRKRGRSRKRKTSGRFWI